MKPQHTPGPWQIVPDYTGKRPNYWHIACQSHVIAGPTLRPSEANARLIAAAPVLLAAAMTLCAVNSGDPADLLDGDSPLRPGLAALHVAIAQATGGDERKPDLRYADPPRYKMRGGEERA